MKNTDRKVELLDIDKGRVICAFPRIPYVKTSYGVRRITNREFARLKGYPEEYLLNDKKTRQTYMMMVRATNVTVARLIAQKIGKYFEKGILENKQIVQQPEVKNGSKDLTNSRIDRQNILNNELALQEIQNTSNIKGIVFENRLCCVK